MIYMSRKIDAYLLEWKNNTDRNPLVVKGPRQVGKTESIGRFGAGHFENVIYINFVEEQKYKMITADGYKTDDIIRNIFRMAPSKRFIAGKNLITQYGAFCPRLPQFAVPSRPKKAVT